ncbi:MAG: hemolysin family protein [bacterium]
MEADLLFRAAAFLALMGLSAGFSASETAFFSLSRLRLQTMRKESAAGRRIASLIERPRRLIISILMGNEIVNIAAAAVFAGTVVSLAGKERSWLAPVLMTPLLVVLGEVTPKSIAARFPEIFSRVLVFPISLFARLVAPLRWVVLQISNGVLTLAGAPPRTRANLLMEDEFLTLVDAGHEEGELDAVEREYIHNIFRFHDRTVAEIAVPRTDMVCWEAGLPLAEVAERVRTAPHSRIPIFREDRDHIAGVLYVKDFLRVVRRESFGPDERLTQKMWRPPLVISAGMRLEPLFRLLRQRRTHIAIVGDEHGGVLGLVTMKDLLEEIFGEIRDEFDESRRGDIEALPDGSFVCMARVPIEEFAERTGWEAPARPGARTLGGLVFHALGRVPRKGERVGIGEVELTVLEMRGTRVLRVRAERREGTA